MTKLYKIRQLTTNNSTGDAFGVTIPKEVGAQFSGTYFNIVCGGSSVLSMEAVIIDKVNAVFKQMTVKIPSEFYPDLKYHQIEIREQIKNTFNALNNCVILTSGCK